MIRNEHNRQWLWGFLLLLLLNTDLYAEVSVVKVLGVDISRVGLKNKIETIKTKQGIAKETKSKEINWYRQADENIADQQWFEFLSANYQKVLKTPLVTLKSELLKAAEVKKVFLFDPLLTNKEAELFIITLKDEVRKITDKKMRLEFELRQYAERPRQIRQEILAANKALEKARVDTNMEGMQLENKYEREALQVYLQTLINATLAQLKKLELEGLSNPIDIQLNRYSQGLLSKQQASLILILHQYEAMLDKLALENAQKLQAALLKTERESLYKHPIIQEIIQHNVQWSRDLQTTLHSMKDYGYEIVAIEAFKKQVASDYKSAEKKIKLAGLSPILGRVLREQRRSLTKHKLQYQQGVDINEETALIGLAQYEIESRQKKLLNLQLEIDHSFAQVIAKQTASFANENNKELKQELHDLLAEQKVLLEKLSNSYLKKLRILGDYDFSKQQLLAEISQYESYLDKRLLWVPSSSIIDFKYPAAIYHSMLWFFSPKHWLVLVQGISHVAQEQIGLNFIFLLGLSFLFYLRPYIKEQKASIKEKVGKPYTDNIYYTFQVLFFNFVLTLPAVVVLLYISHLLHFLPFNQEFSHAVAAGLYHAAIALLILQFLFRLLGDQGVAELHFRWKKSTVCLLRKQVSWIQFCIIPCVFIIQITSDPYATEHADSLGRLALIIFMGVLLVFSVRLLKPKRGILSDYFANNKQCWGRLRYLWLLLFVSVPFVILIFSILGYYVSALELQQKVVLSMRMIFIAIIVYSIIIRWLGLTNRELALKNARIKHESEEVEAEILVADRVIAAHEEILDIPKINQQTGKIINVLIGALLLISFWLIWRNILPAFSFIDNIVLWQYNTMLNGQEILQAVTLRNFFIACLYVFLISIVAINFSGVMELLVFRYLDTEAGSRYAVNQLAKYSLVTLGFISVANELGGSWAKVQWLVAALTVGLGFGLQEIFANMVSGIILLFERPIRVGDTVTVDNVTGKVTQIDMRATTIIDWDHKELIVPNKTFITNQLINWTLTDSVTRVVIALGVSYNSDVALVHRVMTETVSSAPLVLKEPEPTIYFLGFGDSSLDFSIRVYVSQFAQRLTVTHDLHMRLLAALRAEGIDIPFPQRDVHISDS